MRLVWDKEEGTFVDPEDYYRKKAAKRFEKASDFPCPYIAGDIPEYVSPVTGKLVDGRAARKEDLKRSGCRELDPSEWSGKFKSEKKARKYLHKQDVDNHLTS